jgi:hypothetical protein
MNDGATDAAIQLCWTRFARLKPSAAGNSTTLTPKPSGTNYQKVDEGVADAADYCLADTLNEKDTYAAEDLPAAANSVDAVMVSGVAAQQAEGAWDARSVVRTGSTDYEGSDCLIAHRQKEFSYRWATNPNTASAWLTSEVNGMEIGMKAVT